MKNGIKQLELLEREKRTALQDLQGRITDLDKVRGDLLIQIATGDESASKKIAENQKQRERLLIEIEAIEALLKGIPARSDLAKAEEVEAENKVLEGYEQRVIDLGGKLDNAAEELVKVVKDIYDVLKDLETHRPPSYRTFINANVGLLEAIGFHLRRYGLWKYIKVGPYLDRESMTATQRLSKNILQAVGILKTRNLLFSKRLRGELPSDRTTCPECGGRMQLIHNMHTPAGAQCVDCSYMTEGES